MAVLFLLLFALFRNNLKFIDESLEITNYLVPTGLAVFFYILSYPIENLLVVEQRSKVVMIFLVLNTITRSIFIIMPFLIFGELEFVIWGLVMFFGLKAVGYFFYSKKRYGWKLGFKRWNRELIRKQLSYTYPLGLGNVVGTISEKIDKIILTANFSSADYAIYSIGQLRIPVMSLLFPSVSNVIAPKITLCKSNQDLGGAAVLWHKIIRLFTRIVVPFTIYSIVTAPELITFLYTDDFLSAANIYRLILITFFIQMLSRGLVLNAFGLTKYVFKIQTVSMVFSIVLALILIPMYGVLGAAITYVGVYYFNGVLQLLKTKKVLKLKWSNWFPWRNIIKVALSSILAGAIIWPLKYALLSKFIFLMTSFCIFTTTVLVALLIFKEVQRKELRSIINVLRK